MYFSASMDDYFCNIKIDDSTQEYTIGTPVSMMSFTKSLSPQISPLKRRQPHSLSTSSDDKGWFNRYIQCILSCLSVTLPKKVLMTNCKLFLQ